MTWRSEIWHVTWVMSLINRGKFFFASRLEICCFVYRTQSQIGRAISSHTFLRAVAIFFHVCDHIMSVVTYHINAISYLYSQKWVTGSSNVVLWVKIAEKMALNEGNWVPWPVSSMKLLKQSDKTNACGMKTMEYIANPRFIFTTKKIWRL